MNFKDLSLIFNDLESTSSRNLMTEKLSEVLKEAPTDQISQLVYLLLGQLGPQFERIDFGIAEKMAIRAIADAAGTNQAQILEVYKSNGDLGLTTEKSLADNFSDPISVNQIYLDLKIIAETSGEGSQDLKIKLLKNLLNKVSPIEAKYIIRIVLGKMRLGFSDKTILDALSVMQAGSKSGRDKLDTSYQLMPDIGKISYLTKKYSINHVSDHISLAIGVPIIPALAQRLKTADEMISKMGEVAVEPKYDGTRIQIHIKKNPDTPLIKTFTRSLETNTHMFPELHWAIDQVNADSIIIDAEAVGFDPETGKLKPFQETITRKRKYDIAEISSQIPIKFFCFDVLYLNGQNTINLPLMKRRELLASAIQPGNYFIVDPLIVTSDPETVRQFHAAQLSEGLEGAMVKKSDGEYQPGRTGWNWVKFKESETSEAKLSDTIDTIVLGYYRGKGKRSNFGVGAFLVGVKNKDNFLTIAKIGTGLTDDQWRELKTRVDSIFSINIPNSYQVPKSLLPDVWADPGLIVEIAADEITKSPLHTSGLSLRFPRLIRFRDDKNADTATTLDEVKTII